MLLSCLPMIHGCGNGTGAAIKPWSVAVVDHTSVRCLEPDSRHLATLQRRVNPPQPDKPDGVSRGQLYAKIDELRLDSQRKADAGQAIADELQRCRRAKSVSDDRSS